MSTNPKVIQFTLYFMLVVFFTAVVLFLTPTVLVYSNMNESNCGALT